MCRRSFPFYYYYHSNNIVLRLNLFLKLFLLRLSLGWHESAHQLAAGVSAEQRLQQESIGSVPSDSSNRASGVRGKEARVGEQRQNPDALCEKESDGSVRASSRVVVHSQEVGPKNIPLYPNLSLTLRSPVFKRTAPNHPLQSLGTIF